jgi:hypothetical protein
MRAFCTQTCLSVGKYLAQIEQKFIFARYLLAPRYKIELFARYYPTTLKQKFAFARYLLAPRYKIELFARYYPTTLKQKFAFARYFLAKSKHKFVLAGSLQRRASGTLLQMGSLKAKCAQATKAATTA